jgi:glycosyltransferase involved in cell wall biosynthesis
MSAAPVRVLELRSVRGTGGGPEKTILLGAAQADPARCRVVVCYIRDSRDTTFDIGSRAAALGVEYVELVERGSFDPAIWPRLRRVIREHAIQIVHAHDYKTDLLAIMLARAEGVIPFATAHGWTGHSRRERWVYYPADRQVLRAFPLTIAVSSQIKSDLVSAGVRPERVRVVLNGIDPVKFRRDPRRQAAARRALGFGEDDLVIGTVGRLEPQKRIDLLLRAAGMLLPHYPRLRLVVAGDGSLRDELAALAAGTLPAENVRLQGHTRDVIGLHHALDVFVQASDYEGTPNAVLEAMALETPVVATSAGGTAELAEDAVHGLIVPVGDAAALAGAIEHTWLHRLDTSTRVARARRRVETTLSFAARMAAVEQMYREMVARVATPRRMDAEQCA